MSKSVGHDRICRNLSSKASDLSEKLVYSGPNAYIVKAVKTFSLTTSVCGAALQPLLWYQMSNVGPIKFLFSGLLGVFVVATPLLLHLITRSFVTELYYSANHDRFRAVTKSVVMTNRNTVFEPRDCVSPKVGFPWATVIAKEVPLYIHEDYFDDVALLIHMKSYLKPLPDKQNYGEEDDDDDHI